MGHPCLVLGKNRVLHWPRSERPIRGSDRPNENNRLFSSCFLAPCAEATDPSSSEELFSSEWHLTLQILINGPMSSVSTRVGFCLVAHRRDGTRFTLRSVFLRNKNNRTFQPMAEIIAAYTAALEHESLEAKTAELSFSQQHKSPPPRPSARQRTPRSGTISLHGCRGRVQYGMRTGTLDALRGNRFPTRPAVHATSAAKEGDFPEYSPEP